MLYFKIYFITGVIW